MSALQHALGKAAGERLTREDALALYMDAPTHVLGRLADAVRARKHPGRIVTYIIDRNVNYTNVCIARCNFCAFYRPVGSSAANRCLRLCARRVSIRFCTTSLMSAYCAPATRRILSRSKTWKSCRCCKP